MEDQKRRILLLLLIFILFFLLLILRLADIQILRHSFYERKSLEQRTRIIELAAQRGDIFDRSGNILATSVDSFSALRYGKGWLARKLSLKEAQKIQKRDPKSIAILKEKKREYPKGRLAAQTLGFAGVDNQGLAGVELAYDEYLRGREGKVITESDPKGRELYGAIRELEPGTDGMNLTLTIDENIQYVAEREIEKQIKKSKARFGICIVMEVESGEILALASKPDFDPNHYQKADKRLWHPVFLDPYEPGSTFKVITVAAGLEEGVITLDTKLKAMDSIKVGGKVVENALPIKWKSEWITISEMLEKSINTGAVQIGLKLGPERFYKYIEAFDFGKRTRLGLWGESKGIVRHWKRWYKPDIGMMTFGQSIAVTPLQLLSAVSAFANCGIMVKPILVKRIESPDGKFVRIFPEGEKKKALSQEVAAQIKKLMRNVVLNGSGKPAEIGGFGVCAKSGTAQKIIPGGRGYMRDHYIASFIGFAPYANPRIISLVIIDDPKGTYWGGRVCGPVFKKVVEYTLRYFNVKPDVL